MKNTQLYVSFTNFTAGKKMKKESTLFRSTKGEGHGFGLVRSYSRGTNCIFHVTFQPSAEPDREK